MTNITLLSSFVLFTLALYFNSVLTTDSDEYTIIDAKRRDGEKKYSPLWFGPRIGRRKRNPSENFFRTEDRDDLKTILAEALIHLENGKRDSNYIPRMGRESAQEGDAQVTSVFTPRVGRQMYQYSPRLGRENDVLLS